MKTIKVNDMHCENCQKKITKALSATDVKFEVSLENHEVLIDGCDNCVKKAMAAITEAGFTPEAV